MQTVNVHDGGRKIRVWVLFTQVNPIPLCEVQNCWAIFATEDFLEAERNTRPPALNATTQAMPSWRWPSRDLFLLSFEPSIWKNCYLGEHRLVAILAPEDFIHSVILVRQESIIFLWRYKRNWIFGYCMRLKNFDLQIVQKTVFNLGTGLPNNVDSLSIV